MARTILSPGVEIVEKDLTLSPILPAGTNIFLTGFANKGPTDEVIQVTSLEEFEQVFGTPTNPAERYFYYSARQILNSSVGSLFVNRLPYGSGTGEGYGSTYGALVYPAVSIAETQTSVVRNVKTINKKYFNLFTSTEDNLIATSAFLSSKLSSYKANGLLTFEKFSLVDGNKLIQAFQNIQNRLYNTNRTLSDEVKAVVNSLVVGYDTVVSNDLTINSGTLLLGSPKFFELSSEQYRAVLDKSAFTSTNFMWSATSRNVYDDPINNKATINTVADFGYAGLIVINKIQSTVNSKYEGHYVGLTDNFNIEPNSPHDSISNVYSIGKSLTSNSGFLMTGKLNAPAYSIPTSKLSFPLQSKDAVGSRNSRSASETLETIGYKFADVSTSKFDDTLCVGIFKLRVSPYTSDALQLDFNIEESYLGSVDNYRLINSPNGGPAKSFFLETLTTDSNDVVVLVNDYISVKNGSISNLDDNGIPKRKIRVLSNAKISSLISESETNYSKVGFHLNDINLTSQYAVDSVTPDSIKRKVSTINTEITNGDVIIDVSNNTNWATNDVLSIEFSPTLTTTLQVNAVSGTSIISPTKIYGWLNGDNIKVSSNTDPTKLVETTIAGISGSDVTLSTTLSISFSSNNATVINSSRTARETVAVNVAAVNNAYSIVADTQLDRNIPVLGTLVTNTNFYDKVYFQPADSLFSVGSYSGNSASSKEVGNIPYKVDRSLRKVENDEIFDLDLVIEGGLGTIHASVCANETAHFDDSQYSAGIKEGLGALASNEVSEVTKANYNLSDTYNSVFNIFDNFTSEVRKDCLFIADPLRHIFVTGSNTLVLSDHNKSFSQYIYNPLKHLYAGANSSYSCTYGNWAKLNDLFTGTPVWVPMSGYIAADIANVDKNFEPWYAPAGFTRGKITNILSLAITPKQKERDMLYKIGVNPIAFFPNDGFNIFGQKTLLRQPSAFDRINVRRLFLYLEKATKKTTKYFIMEPNTTYTRGRVVATLNPIFNRAKNTQGLYDYQIICDTRNNPPSVIDQNEMVVDIYLKPVRTAEFILVNFYATSTGTNFNEIIGG